MKKILSLCLAVLFLSLSLSLHPAAAAEEQSIHLDADYRVLTYMGETYSRVDVSMLDLTKGSRNGIFVSFDDIRNMDNISVWSSFDNVVFWIEMDFSDGSSLAASFLRDADRAQYNRLIAGEADSYTIDFGWPSGNIVKAAPEAIRGETVTLEEGISSRTSTFTVMAVCGSFSGISGFLAIFDGQYYYINYTEVGSEPGEHDFINSNYTNTALTAHLITDPTLIADLRAAEEAYYGDDLGFVYDNTLTELVSSIFLIFIFGALPFVLFILFLVLAVRAKGVYRRLLGAVCLFSAAELVIFGVICTLIARFP